MASRGGGQSTSTSALPARYIARDSDFYAADLVEQVVLSVEKLLRFPKLGRVVSETQDEKIRELVYQSYRIIYRAAELDSAFKTL